MAPRLISLRRDDRCVACECEVAAGTKAWWDSSARTVTCEPCGSGSPTPVTSRDQQPAQSEAGGSARREYERRRDERDRRVREKHPRLGGFLLAVTDEPQSTRAWADGATGEETTGRWLDRLAASTDLTVLHDRRMPRSRANIDHIVIAPRTVFVIDSKRYKGRVEQRGTGSLFKPGPPALYVAGRDRTTLAGGVHKQTEAVEAAITNATVTDYTVVGVLLFTEGDVSLLARPFAIEHVEVHWPRSLSKRLKETNATFDEVAPIVDVITAAFPPA